MTTHGSATTREEASHATRTTRTATIIDALKRRAESVLNDRSIDAQSRAILRYALETNDPWLAKLVRCADAGETIFDTIDFSQPAESGEDVSSEDKIEVLTEMICREGDEAGTKAAALLVLMATLENSTHPKALANQAKHLAFNRCGELNLHGMVDAQISILEGELFAPDAIKC